MLIHIVQKELRRTTIKVQALCPGFTYSGFHDTNDYKEWSRTEIPKPLWMDADRVVQYSLKMLKKKKVIIIPGLLNRIMVFFKAFFIWFADIVLKFRKTKRDT